MFKIQMTKTVVYCLVMLNSFQHPVKSPKHQPKAGWPFVKVPDNAV